MEYVLIVGGLIFFSTSIVLILCGLYDIAKGISDFTKKRWKR